MPRVSVTMVAHNTARFIGAAIESILAQDFEDYEFLIVDDGSTDRSAEVVRAHAARDPRIVFVSRENRGITPSRNEALALARGEYLAVMDSDDIALAGRLRRQVEYLDHHPECVAVGSRALFIDPEGDPLAPVVDALTHEEIDAGLLGVAGHVMVHPAVMFRRAAVVAVGAYGALFPEDYDLFLRLAEVGKLANLPEILLHYRQHDRNSTYLSGEAMWRAVETMVQDACRRRQVPYESSRRPAVRADPSATLEKWAWWALGAGHVRTARKHAFRAVRLSPLKPASWKLLACALRGR